MTLFTPNLLKDNNNAVIQDLGNRSFRGEYSGTNIIYRGYAKPGADEGALCWQICKLTYSASNVTEIKWPTSTTTNGPSTAYEFSWTNRASYTYT